MTVRDREDDDESEDLMTEDESDKEGSYTSVERALLNSSIKDTRIRKSYQENKESIKSNENTKLCRHISYIWIASGFVVLVGVLVVNCLPRTKTTQDTSIDRSKHYMCVEHAQNMHITLIESMEQVQSKFRNQNLDIWPEISSSLYNALLCPGKPGIIILLGDTVQTIKCLAHQLASVSSRILGKFNYLTLTPKDFKNDIGEVIHELKDVIAEKKIVVVEDLLRVNSEALKAFHNFCDTENPLIGDALYIITMTTDNYNTSKNELYNAEKCIMDTFRERIEKDVLDPLITRITCGAVVLIQPEPDVHTCTL